MFRVILAPVRTVVAVVAVLTATLLLASYLIVLVRIRPRTRQVTPVMRIWARWFLLMTGTRVSVKGLEKIDPEASYVFSGNHISNIDVPVMIATLPVSVRFLAKKELFRVPILGSALRSIHMVETDRQAGPSAHRAINVQVTRVIEEGLSLVIYPEGTRSPNAELMPFKKGAFRIAIDNEMPIVPVTISGSERVWKPGKKLIFGGRVELVVHDPIPTTHLTQGEIATLRDTVFEEVAASYAEIRRS